jgi:hypothetical protein
MAGYPLGCDPPTNAARTAPKRRRQPDPDMFDGTRKQYQVFYQQLTAKVENDKDDFESDKRACDYAFARLKGTAATLTLPYMNQMRASGAWSFDLLLRFFDQMFGDSHKEERARDKLWSMSLTFLRTRSISSFASLTATEYW